MLVKGFFSVSYPFIALFHFSSVALMATWAKNRHVKFSTIVLKNHIRYFPILCLKNFFEISLKVCFTHNAIRLDFQVRSSKILVRAISLKLAGQFRNQLSNFWPAQYEDPLWYLCVLCISTFILKRSAQILKLSETLPYVMYFWSILGLLCTQLPESNWELFII